MRAAVFYEKHKIIVEDLNIREPNDNEVLVRVKYCGVCGTDVHIYEGAKGSTDVNPPRILGHEFSGQVEKIGKNVTKVKIGDKVAIDPNDYCNNCYYCNNAKKHLCSSMTAVGVSLNGGFAEYALVKENLVFKVADSVSYESAAMTEPISCCLHGIDLMNINQGDTVMIVGAGNIGLIMIQLVKYKGAVNIIAVEPIEKRREKAKKYGANIVIDPVNDCTENILKENNIFNIDKIIDCAGKIQTAEYSIKYAGKGAEVMLFGLTSPDDELKIKPFELFQREITIKTSFVNPYAFERAIHLLESNIINVSDIITDIIELENINDVFTKKLYLKDGKVLVKA
ncbi:zinc-dependent alcohol dehydrogenase family protein [Brachyspira sp. G79]|uniref:zinc-dependent alcohol dehydrogenase family protein n=1 Tax=Brachyspira sp. G79 TaxID=1358104 RepID=UPI000BBBC6DD|nr:zinc-dependent alcohol dehydrogenase family protein [Brachyspira sp. G79]PCG20220.1 alcohol dehydrogenase [Brachyspira sp. G79]